MSGDWRNGTQASIRFELDDYYVNEDDYKDAFFDDDDYYLVSKKKAPTKSANSTSTAIGTCPICFESKPVHKLVKSCKHASACWECLHAMYVTTSQTSFTHYPLHCFDLNCRKHIGEFNMIKLGLFQNDGELQRHRQVGILAKSHRDAGRTTVNCPSCDHPQIIQTKATVHNRSHHKYRCRSCNHGYDVDAVLVDRPTIHALELMGNNGWASCPRCGILVVKGGGCNSMRCVCSEEFDWLDALANREKHRVLATDEMYTFRVQRMATKANEVN